MPSWRDCGRVKRVVSGIIRTMIPAALAVEMEALASWGGGPNDAVQMREDSPAR